MLVIPESWYLVYHYLFILYFGFYLWLILFLNSHLLFNSFYSNWNCNAFFGFQSTPFCGWGCSSFADFGSCCLLRVQRAIPRWNCRWSVGFVFSRGCFQRFVFAGCASWNSCKHLASRSCMTRCFQLMPFLHGWSTLLCSNSLFSENGHSSKSCSMYFLGYHLFDDWERYWICPVSCFDFLWNTRWS